MIRNFDVPLAFPNGTVIKRGGEDALLRDSIVTALAEERKDRFATGEEKFKRWNLAVKILVGGDVELSSEELGILREHCGAVGTPILVGPLYKILDAESCDKV